MTEDLLQATLQTISDRATVAWPPNFKEDYATTRLATEKTHAPPDNGLDSSQWLADNLQYSDNLGVLMDATETESRDVLINGTDGGHELEYFDRVMTIMNSASSKAPNYASSCSLLGLDPTNPVVGKIKLDPHQVVAAAWACSILSVLHFAYVGDDMGLGKTVTAFAIIDRLYTRILSQPPCDPPVDPKWPLNHDELTAANLRPFFPASTFKPTLVLFPSIASSTWNVETQNFPGFMFKYWFGDSSKFLDGSLESIRTLNSRCEDMVAFIRSLDPENPDTGKTVIFCTITTWRHRAGAREGVQC